MNQKSKITTIIILCFTCLLSIGIWPADIGTKVNYFVPILLILATALLPLIHIYKSLTGEKLAQNIFSMPLIVQALLMLYNLIRYTSFGNIFTDNNFNIFGCTDCDENTLPISFYVIIILNVVLLSLLIKWVREKIDS
jgi:hypothetical protein